MRPAYSFRPRLWAVTLALAACAALIALGNWQSRRGEEKRALAARLELPAIEVTSEKIDPTAFTHRRVMARGTFAEEHTVFLDNKVRRGRPGYEVVTPLRLNGIHVLVIRGWVQGSGTRDALPGVITPAGQVRLEGVALSRLPRALSAGPESPGKVRQNLDIQSFAAESGLQLHPIVIEQHSELPDGLLREWPRSDVGAGKHDSYALQWYSLAGLAIALLIVLSSRRAGAR